MESLLERLIRRTKVKKQEIITREDILIQAENELLLIQRENELDSSSTDLESIFYTSGKAAMMSAKFYHECKVLKISCVLDVHTQFGEIDSIIEINNKFYLIEFKSHDNLLKRHETIEQVSRYLKHNYPVILISNSSYFTKMLIDLKDQKIDNSIYIYSSKGFNKLKLSTEDVNK